MATWKNIPRTGWYEKVFKYLNYTPHADTITTTQLPILTNTTRLPTAHLLPLKTENLLRLQTSLLHKPVEDPLRLHQLRGRPKLHHLALIQHHHAVAV